MSSFFREALVSSLVSVLQPVAKLMLMSGLGCAEFISIAKRVFVQVASDEYGIRGRPTNISRIAAMTGLSRKDVHRIRSEPLPNRWSPDMESNPANTVLHYWHYDPDYCESPGSPKKLAFDGERSFVSLVRKYAGDIPAGAMRKELTRRGMAVELDDKTLRVDKRYGNPSDFHPDFIRNFAFSMSNLGSTVLHNAAYVRREGNSITRAGEHRRLERSAWTEHLSPESVEDFRQWVTCEGTRFVENADHWIGENELPKDLWSDTKPRSIGVGVYFFEED